MMTTVTAKGQVTIPKAVRDLLGIRPGSKVDFQQTADGSIALTKADDKKPVSSFQEVRGHAGKRLDTDAIMAMTRGEA